MPRKRKRTRPEGVRVYLDSNLVFFVEGVGSTVDLFGTLHSDNLLKYGPHARDEALASDCVRIGHDFWRAVERFNEELSPYRQESLFGPEEIEASH